MANLAKLNTLNEAKLSKEETLELINTFCHGKKSFIQPDVLAYLCGYTVKSVKKTEEDIEKEMLERERKHKKAIKFAKKKTLPIPEMDNTPIERTSIIIDKNPDSLPVNDPSFTGLKNYVMFGQMVERLQEYQVFNVELRGKSGPKMEKDERNLMTLFDQVYKHQGHVVRAWREIEVDYQLGSNDVIFNEILKDYANFVAYLTEYQKIVNQRLKSEPRLMTIYKDIFKDFNPKANWFEIALEDALSICAGTTYKSKVPANLSPSKRMFWDTFKSSTKEAKDFYKQ